MELKYTELDNNSNNLSINFSNEKYWEKEQEPQKEQQKKKKVTFDDILSNMNLVVNKSGVLQYMSPIQNEPIYYNKEQNYNQTQIYNQEQQIPLDQNVKQSYIYNKYFQDYNDSNMQKEIPQIRVPKTIEEYKKMLLDDKIKQIAEKKRISQIKSTKLLFTTPININVNKNKLHMMNFR